MGLLGSNEYRFAQALLVFSSAWEELTKASLACPEQDVSDLYPFYLLDYEEIQPAVKSWCLHHASRIMKEVPDKVYNPACVQCSYMKAGLDPTTGLCMGFNEKQCGSHPYVMFEPAVVLPFLKKLGVDTTDLKREALQLLYVRKAEEVNEKNT